VPAWARRHSLPLTSLAEPVVARHALHAITLRLDGGRAAAAAITRKRAVFRNALGYAAGLGLAPGYVRRAGWQSSSWLKDVAAKAPSLAEVVAAGTPGRDTLTILTLLRDAVHEAGLPALAVAGLPGRPGERLAGLPRGDSAQILAAFNRQGGRGLGAARAPARKAARRARRPARTVAACRDRAPE
jgi:hypothetical protein